MFAPASWKSSKKRRPPGAWPRPNQRRLRARLTLAIELPGRAGGELGVRGVRELAEQARDHECSLLTDINGVVADPLQGARHENHLHGPLACIGVIADLDRDAEAVAVQAIDLLV